MKLHQPTKQQNRNTAYGYLGIGLIALGLAMWKFPAFYAVTVAMIILTGYRLFWLERKLR